MFMYNKKLTLFAGHMELLRRILTSTTQKGYMIYSLRRTKSPEHQQARVNAIIPIASARAVEKCDRTATFFLQKNQTIPHCSGTVRTENKTGPFKLINREEQTTECVTV